MDPIPLRFTAVFLLLGILYAGLKPFKAPLNGARLVSNPAGVEFESPGTLFTKSLLAPPGASGRTLELWIKPKIAQGGAVVLALFDPDAPRFLSLTQDRYDFHLDVQPTSAWRSVRTDIFPLRRLMMHGDSAFLMLSFGADRVMVYRDGYLIATRRWDFSPQELSGQLVLGNSPIFHNSWLGLIRQTAVYDRSLNAAEAKRHYLLSVQGNQKELAQDPECVSMYVFDQNSGGTIKNQARRDYDLVIPPKYMLQRPTLLDPVWRSFSWSAWFWSDAALNIAGFIPLGFTLCAVLAVHTNDRRARLLAFLFGTAVSVAIEAAQWNLPTRDSSMTDVITNSFGTLLGANLFLFRNALSALLRRTPSPASRTAAGLEKLVRRI
jgi:hypothetical protein